MKRTIAIVFCLAIIGMALGAKAIVNDADNPYSAIVDRNVFGLKDPPPPPTNDVVKPPPANILLTGITTILGKRQALLEWTEPNVPGQPPGGAGKKNYGILSEGQRDGQIEVLEIDDKKGTVKVKNYGETVTLGFKETPKSSTTASPPSIGGIPSPISSRPSPTAASSGGTTTANFGNTTAGAAPAIPSRQMRLPPSAVTASTPAATSQTPQAPQLSVEEQIILLEAEALVNENNPAHPPVPPTPVSPNRNVAPPPPPPGVSAPPAAPQ